MKKIRKAAKKATKKFFVIVDDAVRALINLLGYCALGAAMAMLLALFWLALDDKGIFRTVADCVSFCLRFGVGGGVLYWCAKGLADFFSMLDLKKEREERRRRWKQEDKTNQEGGEVDV